MPRTLKYPCHRPLVLRMVWAVLLRVWVSWLASSSLESKPCLPFFSLPNLLLKGPAGRTWTPKFLWPLLWQEISPLSPCLPTSSASSLVLVQLPSWCSSSISTVSHRPPSLPWHPALESHGAPFLWWVGSYQVFAIIGHFQNFKKAQKALFLLT